MLVEVRDGRLWLEGEQVDLEHSVAAAERLASEAIVVLYDYTATGKPPWETFRNLVAIDAEGDVRWVARLPESQSDTYVGLVSVEPLVAQSFSGYRCTIDPDTGEITDREFTK